MIAEAIYDGQLSATAYVMLLAVLTVIFGGLLWCFYRAIKAAGERETAVEQLPDDGQPPAKP